MFIGTVDNKYSTALVAEKAPFSQLR